MPMQMPVVGCRGQITVATNEYQTTLWGSQSSHLSGEHCLAKAWLQLTTFNTGPRLFDPKHAKGLIWQALPYRGRGVQKREPTYGH